MKDKVVFRYRRYCGSIHYSLTRKMFHGKLHDILVLPSNDVKDIKYSGKTMTELLYAFRACVDKHIEAIG